MLKVWGRKSSSNVQAVMWCIAELGLDHERIDAGLTYGVVDTPEYLAMNPNGMIPTIRDGDNPPLWEAGAILRYLANGYAVGPFWPADPVARADVDKVGGMVEAQHRGQLCRTCVLAGRPHAAVKT